MKETLIYTCKECGVRFDHEQEFSQKNSSKNLDNVKALVTQKKSIKKKIDDARLNNTIEKNGELYTMLSEVNKELLAFMDNPIHEPTRCPNCRNKKKEERRAVRGL